MAWVAPRTFVAGEVHTAAHHNQIRDSLNETVPAKATTLGDTFYATAANAISRLGIGAEDEVYTVTSGIPGWGGGDVDKVDGLHIAHGTGTVEVLVDAEASLAITLNATPSGTERTLACVRENQSSRALSVHILNRSGTTLNVLVAQRAGDTVTVDVDAVVFYTGA